MKDRKNTANTTKTFNTHQKTPVDHDAEDTQSFTADPFAYALTHAPANTVRHIKDFLRP